MLSSLLLGLLGASVVPVAYTLTLDTPSGWNSASANNISWTSASGDPATFSLELVPPANLPQINGPLAVADSVNASDGSTIIDLPSVPVASGYTLEAVQIGNISNVLATSGSFSIAASPPGTATEATGSSAGTGAPNPSPTSPSNSPATSPATSSSPTSTTPSQTSPAASNTPTGAAAIVSVGLAQTLLVPVLAMLAGVGVFAV